jgi:autotransporter-associated beta strand protein
MFARTSRNSVTRRTRIRPVLERLEDRCVPVTTRTWLGTFDQFWDFAGNWRDGNGNPGAPQTGDVLVFNSAGISSLSTNNLGADKSFDSIRIESSDYLVTGDAVQLTSNVPVVANYSSGSSTMTLAVNLVNSPNIDVNGAASSLTLNGVVSGSVGLTKRQAGTLNLGGNSTYTGSTTISAGTLAVVGNDRLPDNTDVTVAPGARLFVNGFDRVDSLNGAGTVEMAAGKRFWVGHNGEDMSFSGVITGNGTVGGLSKEGVGTLTLSGGPHHFPDGLGIDFGTVKLGAANIITDSSFVNLFSTGTFHLNGFSETIGALGGAGAVNLGNSFNTTLTVGGNGISTIYSGTMTGGGVIGGGFGGALRKVGNEDLSITGLLNVGAVNIDGGSLTVAANDRIHDSTFVTVNSPGRLNVNGFERVGSLAGSGRVELASSIRLWAGGNNADTTFSGIINGNGTAGGLSKEGIGVMTLSGGPHHFPDGLGIDNGTIKLGAANIINDSNFVNFFAAGTLDLNNFDETIGSLGGNGTINLGTGVLTVGRNGFDSTYAGTINGAGGLTKVAACSLTLTNSNSNHTGTTWIKDGILALGGTGPDNKLIQGPVLIGDSTGTAGSAALFLARNHPMGDGISVTVASDGLFNGNGHDEYIGALTVTDGEVRMGNADLGLNGLLTMAGGSISASGTLGLRPFAGVIAQSTAAQTAVISGKVDLNGLTRTFTVNDGPQFFDLAIDGVISNGGFIKNGPGILRFLGSAANTYTGPTAVNDGFLILAKPAGVNAIGGPLVLGDGFGTQGAVQLDSDEQIANSAPVTIRSDGFLQLAFGSETIGTLSMVGGIINIFQNRTLTLTADANFSSAAFPAGIGLFGFSGPPGQLSLGASSRTFTVADGPAAVDLAISVPIVGVPGIGLTKAGPGTMTVNNAVVLSGPSTVAAGTLQVNDLFAGPVTVSQGATITGGGTVGALTMQDGSILSPGSSVGLLGAGNLTLGAATRVIIEIQNIAPGTQDSVIDSVDARGAVNLGASARLELVPLNAANFPVGTKLTIIRNDGTDPVVGAFKDLPEGAVVNSRYRISYKGGDGNDVELTRIASYIVTGTDAGTPPRVRVFNAGNHAPVFDFLAYPGKGGVRVASADFNRDGFPDIVTAPGPGTRAIVNVFSGNTQAGQTPQLLRMLQPYGKYKGGAFVATGDVDRDGVPDIIVGPGKDTAAIVKIFSGANGGLIGMFNPFGGFKGGVTVATGDINADGKLDIVVGKGPGSKPLVRVFDAATRTQLPGSIGNFLAYRSGFSGGVNVAAGDVNGDGIVDIITGPGAGASPMVKVFDRDHVAAPRLIAAYPATQKRGVRVAAADVNGDGKLEILTSLGPGGKSEVKIFNGVSLAALDSFFAEAGAFTKGLFIAGSR